MLLCLTNGGLRYFLYCFRICDKCGKHSPIADNYNDALKFAKENGWTTGISLDRAIVSIKKLEKIKEILSKRDNAFDGQEFGASYSDLDNIIEEIREVIVKG